MPLQLQLQPVERSAVHLRPYQEAAIAHTLAALQQGERRMYFTLPTGTGKTVVLSQLTESCERVLLLAHRVELIDQLERRLRGDWDRPVGVVMARRNEVEADLVVATPQSLHTRRLKDLAASDPPFDTLIVDEAHHAVPGSQYAAIAEVLTEENPDLAVIGCTATPFRADRRRMQEFLPTCTFSRTIDDMQRDGWLCGLDWRPIQVSMDLTRIRTTATPEGMDYDVHQLSLEAERADVVQSVVDQTVDAIGTRTTLVFGVTVAHAQALAAAYARAGITAAAIWGDMHPQNRAETLRRWQAGSLQLVANCAVLTEGFDFPAIDALVIARPTRSPALYCLDLSTEILTDKGWVGVDAPLERLGARAAGFDTDTGEIRWTSISGVVRRMMQPHERMYRLTSVSADIRVTNRHRMVYRTRQGRRRERTAWQFASVEGLTSVPDMYEIPVAGCQPAPGAPLSDDEIRFVGWVLSDGTVNPANGQIQITQAEHQPWLDELERVIRDCGLKYGRHVVSDRAGFATTHATVIFTVSRGGPRETDKHLRGWAHLAPYLDKDFAEAMELFDRRQVDILLEALHLGDGTKFAGQSWTRRSYHLSTGNKTFADRLQSLCVRRGYRCNISTREQEGKQPLYFLHIKDSAVRHLRANADDRATLSAERSRNLEPVWCIETGTGTIVTRRRGKVAIMGNCQMLGRGTRTAPAKADCLVIDVSGNEPIDETAQVILPDVASVDVGEDGADDPGPGAPKGGKRLLVRDPSHDQVYRWVRDTDSYVLPAALGVTLVLLADPRGSGLYQLGALYNGGRIERIGARPDSIWEQQRRAHDWLSAHGVQSVATRGQAWHDRPATEKQLAFLRRVDPRATGDEWTRGQASAAIARALARRAARGLRLVLWPDDTRSVRGGMR